MKKSLFYLSLGVGLVVIIICIHGFHLLRERPGLPPTIDKQNIIKIDSLEIKNERYLQFIFSKKSIGDEVTIFLRTPGKTERLEVRLIPFYPKALIPLMYLSIGLFIFALSILVFLLCKEETRAHIFYWTGLAFGSAIIIAGAFYLVHKGWSSYLPGSLFYISFAMAPALLLHFSFTFSKSKVRISRLIIYLPALIFAGALVASYLLASLKSSIEIFRTLLFISSIFRIYVLLFVLLAILHIIMCYKKSHFYEERAQIKWIFFGLFVGLGPYILFNQLPLILKMDSIISEEVSNVFFILIPLAFIFSIVRFKFMNIEFVINRSLVYSLLTIFTISLYLLSIRLFYTLFSRMFAVQESVISVAGALVAAGAFYPARRKIQELVDKAFFRQSYDYRKSTLSFNERAVKIANLGHLIDYFMIKVRNTLPLEYMGIFIYSTDSGKRRLLIKRDGESERSSLDSLRLDPDKILARERAVKTTENIDFSEEIFLQEKNVEVIIPISFKMTALDGLLSVGKKKSGERFSRDDIELLLTMSRELTVNLERIRLQEEVIYEKAEREKLDELSRLKTEFISTVSHELRTPMSSIQGITEMLQEEKIKDRVKRSELLKLIAGESSRLSRFIHNILDFGKIEQQVKTYNFQKKEIQLVIEEVVRLFRYQLDKKGFILSTDLPENPVILEIDEDAVKQALTNLVDNAIKYSSEQKEIDIKLIERENHIEISVKDKGIGIPPEEQEKIFEKFYRVADASHYSPKGVGLGLKIIKHIMSAHKGEIKVESQPNRGSTFSLIFPKS